MEEIITQIASDYGIDEEIVTRVVRSQFKFVKDVMETGNMESVHLTYLGKLAIKPNRLKYLPEGFTDNIYRSGKEVYVKE